MRYKMVAIFYFLFACTTCHAQTISGTKNNAVSLEIGKSGLIYNLNFDHRFPGKDFGFRFGVGSNFAKYLQAFTGGAGGYYLLGRDINFLELGVDLNYLSIDEVSDDQKGFSIIYPNYPVKTFYASANVGYRRYGKKTLFRIGVSPGVIKNEFLQGGYISLGLTFL
jgi:hypothetical protein